MTIRVASVLIATVLLAGSLGEPALAISTLEDTLRDLPRISRTPSTWPPNNAVHRGPMSRRTNGNGAGIAPGTNGHSQDEGPGVGAVPNVMPASAAPYAIALSEGPTLNKDFLCGGVLIAPTWALTAAHCIDAVGRRWPNDEGLYVFTQTANLSAPGRRFAVTQVVVHPQYDARALKNDIALIKIEAKGGAGAPIRFEGPRSSEQVGEIVTILGWGITAAQFGQQHREEMQAIQNAVLDDGVCFSSPNFPELRGTGVFCGRTLLRHHDICFRFGGSPMVLYDDAGRLYVLGLVSWPATCPSNERKPNVFLDVQAYVPWIKSVINAPR